MGDFSKAGANRPRLESPSIPLFQRGKATTPAIPVISKVDADRAFIFHAHDAGSPVAN
jgi:hypothetical protein